MIGLGICDGAAIEIHQPSFVLKLHRSIEVEHLTSIHTIANTLLNQPSGSLPTLSVTVYFIKIKNDDNEL